MLYDMVDAVCMMKYGLYNVDIKPLAIMVYDTQDMKWFVKPFETCLKGS